MLHDFLRYFLDNDCNSANRLKNISTETQTHQRVAPSGHDGRRAVRHHLVLLGQQHRLRPLAQVQLRLQLEQREIVIDLPRIVSLVLDHPLDGVQLAAAGVQAGADAHAQIARILVAGTVAGRQDPARRDDGAAADVAPRLQRHLVGEVGDVDRLAADNVAVRHWATGQEERYGGRQNWAERMGFRW